VNLVLASLAIALHVVLSAAAAPLAPDDADAELEKRVHAFSQEVRCLVCQNETLADSRAELAVDLRREIRAQMKAGRSNEEITAFLTERYGDFVLYRPPLKPSTYPLWFGPFVLLGGGLFTLYRHVKRWPASSEVRPLSAGARKRVRHLLQAREREETT
jgi:cytochrome c-type biogenesis protein CcmH